MSTPRRDAAAAGEPAPSVRMLAEFTGRDRTAARRCQVLLAATPAEARQLTEAWTGQAIDIIRCDSLPLALLRVGRVRPDAVVVVAGAGPLTPVDFVRIVRVDDSDLPVIVGLDKDHTRLGVDVLTAGASAVVRCPFNPEDLLRILSAAPPQGYPMPIRPLPIEIGGGRLRVDGASPRMWLDGREIVLRPVEYLLLRYLAGRPEEIISRVELFDAVWGPRGPRSSNTLTVHLARLRRRLQGEQGEDWIRSVRGFGYQFLVPHREPTDGVGAGPVPDPDRTGGISTKCEPTVY
jgi:DNA-binding response OmpR family regulator